jgi:hypothetical protein
MEQGAQDNLIESKSRILNHMSDFIKLCKELGGDAGYTDVDVAECGQILDKFIHSMTFLTAREEEQINHEVKTTVLALNRLNEKGLIETREREVLCEFIDQACLAIGYEPVKDITEAWRKW